VINIFNGIQDRDLNVIKINKLSEA